MRLKIGFMSLMLLLISTISIAQTLEDINQQFAKALETQQSGDSKKAIALYENIIKEGFVSTELHNNLGLAYIDKKQLGEAILNFERAIRLDRNNADAKNNLTLAKASIREPISELQPMFLIRWWNGLRNLFSSSVWAILFFIVLAEAIGLQVFRIFRKEKTPSAAKTASTASFVIAFLILILGLQSAALEQDSGQVIVTKDMVGLREVPDLGSPEGTILYEGSSVYIRIEEESWTEVELPNGVIGWLPNSMITKI